MCGNFHFPIQPPWTHKRESRTEIQHKRLYAFAANRFSDAKSPGAYKFWCNIMDKCVQTKTEYVPMSLDEQRVLFERFTRR